VAAQGAPPKGDKECDDGNSGTIDKELDAVSRRALPLALRDGASRAPSGVGGPGSDLWSSGLRPRISFADAALSAVRMVNDAPHRPAATALLDHAAGHVAARIHFENRP